MKRQKKVHTPANEVVDVEVAKVDDPDSITKPDVDDKTERCAACRSTFIQRIAGGNKRCGQCGTQIMRNNFAKPDPGQVRK